MPPVVHPFPLLSLALNMPHRWQGDKELFEELAGSALAVEEGWAMVGQPGPHSLHAMLAQILAEALSGKLAGS
jgi:hypothetical protein